jgi:serine/threonine-protein kinase CTR1
MTCLDEARWKIEERDVSFGSMLAEGAHGAVWSGQWKGSPVALKVLKNFVDEDGDALSEIEDDFQIECQFLQQLNHPNLLRFFGFGLSSNGGFIVTELMPMGSLFDVLRKVEIDLSWPDKVSVALSCALGMEHLHNLRFPIIHRDLKVRGISPYLGIPSLIF